MAHNLRGAKEANTGPHLTRYEQRHDRQFLRPSGSRTYRAASCFMGIGIFDEKGRRAKFVTCFATEADEHLRAVYHRNTGVTPYHSDKAMMVELPDDLDMLMFGSNCRSIATIGLKRGSAAIDD
jgi:site-specific DNA-cytosine methylase